MIGSPSGPRLRRVLLCRGGAKTVPSLRWTTVARPRTLRNLSGADSGATKSLQRNRHDCRRRPPAPDQECHRPRRAARRSVTRPTPPPASAEAVLVFSLASASASCVSASMPTWIVAAWMCSGSIAFNPLMTSGSGWRERRPSPPRPLTPGTAMMNATAVRCLPRGCAWSVWTPLALSTSGIVKCKRLVMPVTKCELSPSNRRLASDASAKAKTLRPCLRQQSRASGLWPDSQYCSRQAAAATCRYSQYCSQRHSHTRSKLPPSYKLPPLSILLAASCCHSQYCSRHAAMLARIPMCLASCRHSQGCSRDARKASTHAAQCCLHTTGWPP